MAEVNISPQLTHSITILVESQKRTTAATLASAMIIASGRPHSVNEVKQLLLDLEFSLAPNPGSGRYQNWEKGYDGNKLHI